jgi:type II secretory pathway pseudopilin PulG
MITRTDNRSGFTLVEVLVLVIVVAIVGVLGFTFYGRMNKQVASHTSQSSVESDVQGAPEVTKTSDLDEAEAILNQTDPAASDSDASQLDSMSSEF